MKVEEEVVLALLLLRSRKKNRKKRKYWIHPYVGDRLLKGQFYISFRDLKQNEIKFFNCFRMSTRSFEELLELLKEGLQGTETNMRLCIPPEEKLAVTLRYLGSGCTFSDLHLTYRLGISTVSKIVNEVCTAIWSKLKTTCMPQPSKEEWRDIANGFKKRANFPNCVGAIDGKHIRIIKPIHSGSLFYNYKNYFSLLLLAVCDSNYRFTYIDVGSYGKCSDSAVFKDSIFYKKLMTKSLNIPEDTSLVDTEGSPLLPHVLVGDEGFGLSQTLLRPFGGKSLTRKKKVYNYRLSRARRYIECSFGILANKWRILHRPLNVSLQLAEDIVKACCILHNFVRVRDGYNFEDTLTIAGFDDMPRNSVPGGRTANDIRDIFADYFVSPAGEVPWQHNRI